MHLPLDAVATLVAKREAAFAALEAHQPLRPLSFQVALEKTAASMTSRRQIRRLVSLSMIVFALITFFLSPALISWAQDVLEPGVSRAGLIGAAATAMLVLPIMAILASVDTGPDAAHLPSVLSRPVLRTDDIIKLPAFAPLTPAQAQQLDEFARESQPVADVLRRWAQEGYLVRQRELTLCRHAATLDGMARRMQLRELQKAFAAGEGACPRA